LLTAKGRRFPVAANVTIFQGAMVALVSAAGVYYAEPATAAANLIVVGVAAAPAYNIGGAAGAISVDVENGTYLMNNDAVAPVSYAGNWVTV
jgi:hypothetical protein